MTATPTVAKSVLNESKQIERAAMLIQMGARMQVLESETTLSYERLIRLYKEIAGKSPSNRPLKKWASNASGTLFSKKRVAQTRLRSDCTGQSGLFAGHLAHFGRTYPRAHA